ncbi:hypothetical protein [Bacillus canaveralius]|uniref:hypothetical protein n=1 Tax=Bacillus canaveralius TaxID=1403243 RepID=UPI001FE4FCF5|nr:hypothetical protein [Bacillus canaveralius]
MNHLTKAIQIVEYHEGLAAGIAKMWYMSRDRWGGDTRVTTPGASHPEGSELR